MNQITSEDSDAVGECTRRLQAWSQQLQSENRSLQNQLTTLQSELESRENQITSSIPALESRIHEFETALSTKEVELADASHTIESLKAELQSKEMALTNSSLSTQDAVRHFQEQLENSQKEAQVKYRDLAERYNSVIGKYKELQHESKSVQESRDRIQREKDDMNAVLTQTRDELSRIQIDYQRVAEEAKDLQQNQLIQTQTEQRIHELQNELTQCHQEMAALDQQKHELDRQVQILMQERDVAKAQAADAVLQIQSNSQRALKDQETLQNRIEQQANQLEATRNELVALRPQLHEMENEVTRQRTMVSRLQELLAEKNKNDNVMTELQTQLQSQEKVHGELQDRVQMLQKEIGSKDLKIQQLQESLARAQHEQQSAGSESRSMRVQLRQLWDTIHQCCREGESSSVERSVSLFGRWSDNALNLDDSLAEVTGEGSNTVGECIRMIQTWSQRKQSENNSLQNQLTAVSASVHSLQNEIQLKEDKIMNAESRVQQLTDQVQVLENQLQAMQSELQKAQAEAASNARQMMESQIAMQDRSGTVPQDLQDLLRDTQQRLESTQVELSEKRQRVTELEAEVALMSRRLREATATMHQVETPRQPTVMGPDPSLTAELEATRSALRIAEQARDQYVNLHAETVRTLESRVGELEQARQMVTLKEQECSRLMKLLQNGRMDANVVQLTEALRAKDNRIVQLESDVQRLTFANTQAKQSAESMNQELQLQMRELRSQLEAKQQDTVRVTELQAQLTMKTQEASRLQQQLLTEIGLVESLKASYVDLDRLLSERLPQGSSSTSVSSLQALLQAKEDHNKYLQQMVSSLESQNQELLAQKMAYQAQVPTISQRETLLERILQRIVTTVTEFFPQTIVTVELSADYVSQLAQMLRDERSLYSSVRKQLSEAQRMRSDLEQKVSVLQNYASGHAHIDQKADAFVQDVVRQRNDFEQKYNNVKLDLTKKETEFAQLERALKQEKATVLKLLNESKDKQPKTELPPEFPELIEECMRICLLAKLDKNRKLDSLRDIVNTLRLVRRSISGALNLLKRENERLDCENKRVKEVTEKERVNSERITAKIKEIIRIVQNQGKALKEFVSAFQALQKKRSVL